MGDIRARDTRRQAMDIRARDTRRQAMDIRLPVMDGKVMDTKARVTRLLVMAIRLPAMDSKAMAIRLLAMDMGQAMEALTLDMVITMVVNIMVSYIFEQQIY